LGKNCKNRLSVGGSVPEPPFASGGATPAYYYNFVEFVSSAKSILFRSKKKLVTTANILPLFLPHFCIYFLIQTLSVSLKEAQKYFLVQGTLAMPL